MGLKGIVAKAAGVAFKAAGDLTCDVVYRRLIVPGPANWDVPENWEEFTVKAIIEGIKKDDMNDVPGGKTVERAVRTVTILKSSIDFKPKQLDRFIINGARTVIENILDDDNSPTIEFTVTILEPLSYGA